MSRWSCEEAPARAINAKSGRTHLLSWGPVLLIGGLGGGYLNSRSIGVDSGPRRIVLAMVLGTSLITAWLSLLACLLPVLPAAILATLLSFLHVRRPATADSALPTKTGLASGFFLTLVCAAAWLSAVGGQQLFPDREFLLWQLPQTANPSLVTGPGMSAVLSLFGTDPLGATLWAMGVVQLLAVIGLFLFCSICLGRSPVLQNVCFIFLLCSSSRGFLIVRTPDVPLLHLWAATALIWISQAGRNRYLALIPATAALAISWPLGLALVICLFPPKPRLLAFLAAGGSVVAFLTRGVAPGWLLAALLLVYVLTKTSPSTKDGLLVSRFCLLELWGPGWDIFAYTALTYGALTYFEGRWSALPRGLRPQIRDGGIRVPLRWIFGFCVFYIALQGVKPGEGYFNDQVLIASQKEHLKLPALFLPRSLESWLSWRGARFGFGSSERRAVELLSQVPGPVVYLSEPIPDPMLSALVALASGKSLIGWEHTSRGGASLAPALSAYLQSGDQKLLAPLGECLVISSGGRSVQVSPSSDSTAAVKAGPLVADFQSLPSVLPAGNLIPVEVVLRNSTSYLHRNIGITGARFEADYHSGAPLQPVEQPVCKVAVPALPPGERTRIRVFLRTAPRPSTFELRLFLLSDDGQSRQMQTPGERLFRTWPSGPPSALPGGEGQKP